MSTLYENITLKTKELPITEKVSGAHSKKTLRKKCRAFKKEHSIEGYVSAIIDNGRVVVDAK